MCGKESAKHAGDAGVMTACYPAPHSLAANGWHCRTKSPACEGAKGRPTCPAATAQHGGRRAARALSATLRSRANGGDSMTAIAPHRAAWKARAGRSVGRAVRSRPWHGISRGTEERSEVVPEQGHRGRPARRRAGGTGAVRHAAAAACDGKGTRVKGLTSQSVAESEPPARQGADCPSQLSSSTGSPAAWHGRGAVVPPAPCAPFPDPE